MTEVPPDPAAAGQQLLAEAADALWACVKAALTVKPALDQPYPDAPEWTPYTRWAERPARQAHDLAMKIRKHLRELDSAAPVTVAEEKLARVRAYALRAGTVEIARDRLLEILDGDPS